MKKIFTKYSKLIPISFIVSGIVFGNAANGQETVLQNDRKTTIPTPTHVVVVIMENHSYNAIMKNAAYIKSFEQDSNAAIFRKSSGVGHPSQPNYLCLYSGDKQGVKGWFFGLLGHGDRSLANTRFVTPNVGAQLINEKKSFATYSEDLPWEGFDGDDSGLYVRRHNPAANWVGYGKNQIDSTTNKQFTSFPDSAHYSELPTLCYVIPNLYHDMHTSDSTGDKIKQGDDWLKQNLSKYIAWAKHNNSLFILTFDEGVRVSFTNRITTIFVGSMVKNGQYHDKINHYNVLRTIEDMYDLPYAGNAATAQPIGDCWK